LIKIFGRKKAKKQEKRKVTIPPISKKDLLSARPVRNPMLDWEERDDGTVVIYIKTPPSKAEKFIMGRASEDKVKRIVLDEVGSFVWTLCDGNHSVNDIIENLSEKYKLKRIEAERSLFAFLRMLSQRMLIGFLAGENK